MSYTFLWYATRGAGAVSMVLLSGVVILGILSSLRVQATGWPRFLTTGLHRNVALTAVVFLALHIITAVVDPYTHLGLGAAVIPFSSYYRTFWLGLGAVAFELLLAIVITSLVRGFVGHRAWRTIHWLAYASWPIAIVHGFGTGTDSWSAWFLAIAAVCVAAVGVAFSYRLLTEPVDPLVTARTAFRGSVDRRQVP
jgi:methionine sulfoxide reductase heme-binding subunit